MNKKLIVDKSYVRQGYNTVCRLGMDHYQKLSVGRTVDLHEPGVSEPFATATIKALDHMNFEYLSDTDVASNYAYRTYDQLAKAMKDLYGDCFSEDKGVSIVGFDVT